MNSLIYSLKLCPIVNSVNTDKMAAKIRDDQKYLVGSQNFSNFMWITNITLIEMQLQ